MDVIIDICAEFNRSYYSLHNNVEQIQLILARNVSVRNEYASSKKRSVCVLFESALTHVIITSNILYKRMLFNSWSNFTDDPLQVFFSIWKKQCNNCVMKQ